MTEKIYEFSEIPYLSHVPRLIWGILHSLTISRITCRLKRSSPAQRKIIRWARTSCQPPPDTVAVAMSAIQIHHVEKITKIKRNTSTKYVSLTMRSQFIYFKKWKHVCTLEMAGTKNALKLRIYHSTSPLLINVSEHAQVAITDPSSVRWHQRNLMVAESVKAPTCGGCWQFHSRAIWRRPWTISQKSHLAAAGDNYTSESRGGARWRFHRRAIWRRPLTISQKSHLAAAGDNYTSESPGGAR